MCYSSTIRTMQLLISSHLFTDLEVKETFLYADVHVLVGEWSTERIPPPNVPRDEHVLPPPVVEGDIELPFVCEQM